MPPKKTSAKVSKKKKKDEEEEDQSSEDEKPKKKTAKVSASKKIKKEKASKEKSSDSGYKGITPEELEKYNEYKEELSRKTLNELKEMCRKNDQKVTGTKPELIDRVAEGKVLGKIPKCTKCGGGRPKYDLKTGIYQCPGYMEDDVFKWCKKKYTKDEITREAWED